MTNNTPPRVASHRGLSLLELTVVIATLIALTSILFFGARSWLRGSDRTSCILTIRNVQVATRSYQNLYGYNEGGRPYADGGTQDIAEHLHNKGYIEEKTYQLTRGNTTCPSGGTYACPQPDVFPTTGQLYMGCSLATSDKHAPKSHSDW